MDGVQLPQGYRATSTMQFTFYHQVHRKSWYSFDASWKDESLNQPWNHPVVLNRGTLDCESSTLTTRSSLWYKTSVLSYGIRTDWLFKFIDQLQPVCKVFFLCTGMVFCLWENAQIIFRYWLSKNVPTTVGWEKMFVFSDSLLWLFQYLNFHFLS